MAHLRIATGLVASLESRSGRALVRERFSRMVSLGNPQNGVGAAQHTRALWSDSVSAIIRHRRCTSRICCSALSLGTVVLAHL